MASFKGSLPSSFLVATFGHCCIFIILARGLKLDKQNVAGRVIPGGGGVLPYMGYIGMCGPKGYGFSAVLVINWVSILAILPPFWS